ncbi:hypothetical protein ACIRST_33450 [Kitasatospora sp. NPDC101447]|uniref:hypothetical protein n=1 Tax=Kitasatospora sp. NPDC101447 TaxID=3364102 RepID=UPI00380950A3
MRRPYAAGQGPRERIAASPVRHPDRRPNLGWPLTSSFREACVRCSLLRPDTDQRERLVNTRDNLIARIAETEHEGRLGEVEDLQVSLVSAQDKLAQLDSEAARRSTAVSIGMPTFGQITARTENPTPSLAPKADLRLWPCF